MKLFESQHLLVLDKPAGLPSVALPKNPDADCAVKRALEICPDLPLAPLHLRASAHRSLEPGILHRLDTLTSGVLAFAKTAEAFEYWLTRWNTESVEKIYIARVRDLRTVQQREEFALPTESANPLYLDFEIGHSDKSSKKMIGIVTEGRMRQIRGNPQDARTTILHSEKITDSAGHTDWILKIKILTGVRHQIRCHLYSIGLPILGDPVYGNIPYSRLALLAESIRLPGFPEGSPDISVSCTPCYFHS